MFVRRWPLRTIGSHGIISMWAYLKLPLTSPRPIRSFHCHAIKNINASQSVQKVQEMKEDEYTKSLAKNQVCEIIHNQDISKNVLLKSIRL